MIRFPKISIIILNWNGWEDTLECLESVYRVNYPRYEVVVLDNGSEDDSVRRIAEHFHLCPMTDQRPSNLASCKGTGQVVIYTSDNSSQGINPGTPSEKEVSRRLLIVSCERNLGFAEGNNVAMRFVMEHSNPEYVLLLNNDTTVDPDFLVELLNVTESGRSIGFAGPKIYHYCMNGRKDIICYAGGTVVLWKGLAKPIGMNENDIGQYDSRKTVDYVHGSCSLIRVEVLREIGLFDSAFFAYWEEVDLCVRGRKAGYEAAYVPSARIWHKISSSTPSITYVYYFTRNRFWFVKKHAALPERLLFLVYFCVFSFLPSPYIYLVHHGSWVEFSTFSRAVLDGLRGKESFCRWNEPDPQ
jgi:GT2 family glycosyltransferase